MTTFVHIEIWQDYQSQLLTDAARQWLQQPNGDLNEPWVFVIDADGRIVARFGGPPVGKRCGQAP